MSYKRTTEFFARFCCCVLIWASLVWPVLADTDDDDGDDYDPLPGRTEEQIDALIFNFDEVVETIILYTALFSLLGILLALALSMRLRRWAGYILLTLASLGWFALFEQHLTGLYWVGFDLTDQMLTFIGIPLISAHFFLAGWYISPESRLSPLRLPLLLATLTPWIALALSWPNPENAPPTIYVILATLGCLSHFLTVPSLNPGRERSIYTRRNGFVVIGAVVLTGFALFGELDEGLDVAFFIRSIFVAVVCLLAFFLVQFVISVLRERDASVRRSLDAARREAEKTQALLDAEKNYARAKDAARRHTMRLATASHDIRQPITSLRSTMAAVAQDQPAEVKTQLKAAFDYLDDLAKSYIDTEETELSQSTHQVENGRETIAARTLSNTLERMFRKEAEQKGLTFNMEIVDRELHVPPLVITRVMSNLLSNAIKHTNEGEILFSASPDENGYVFAVTNSAEIPAELREANPAAQGVKGSASEGSGLGLAIVSELSERHGLDLSWSSSEGEGTVFQLRV